jgi:hypothetical protein
VFYDCQHWVTHNNILEYLGRTKDVFLVFGGLEDLAVNDYPDASFQTDLLGRDSSYKNYLGYTDASF